MTQTFGPYTPVRRAGAMYFVSGQVGVDPATHAAHATVEMQTRQALKNMQAALAEQGVDMEDVIKTTIFVTDMNDFATVNSVYETFFGQPRPARSTVQVAHLPKVGGSTQILVEIDAVAYKEL